MPDILNAVTAGTREAKVEWAGEVILARTAVNRKSPSMGPTEARTEPSKVRSSTWRSPRG